MVGDIEIYTGSSWVKVEDGSAGFDPFKDGVPNSGWGGYLGDYHEGGEFYGASLRFDSYITTSKIRITNFDSDHNPPDGSNYGREFVVYGYPDAIDCDELWSYGLGMRADLYADCVINYKDLELFAEEWLGCNDPNNVNCP